MVDKTECRGHRVHKHGPLRSAPPSRRRRARAAPTYTAQIATNSSQKPLVSILKRELLKKHVIDERMFKGNRPIGQCLIQMPFRRRIARRAPVLAAQQGKRRFAVFPNAAALPVNPFRSIVACNVQRVRPIRLLRQRRMPPIPRPPSSSLNALFILPFQRRIPSA